MFLDLPNKDTQDLHLQRLIEKNEIKTRRPRKENAKQRAASFSYYVMNGSSKIKVCRTAFMSMHGIRQKRLFRITTLLLQGETPRDKRGTNPNPRKIPEHVTNLISDHIQSFPVKVTHYGGKEVRYLDARLSIVKMHDMFATKHPDLGITYSFYRAYFVDNFNYRFGRPQIDVCSKCEELTAKLKSPHICESAKRDAQREYDVHQRRSKGFYRCLQEVAQRCTKDNNVVGLAFDYMQNLPLPNIPVQEVFYMRQLWVNVFCIHNLKTNNCVIYMYHEGQGNKGANEVSSLLNDYINEYVPENAEHLHLFSDGCPGQNKNHTMIRMCLGLAASKKFQTIKHYFPERGHSFLPCDRDFGVFKKQLKKVDRVYTIREYMTIIVNSKRNVVVKIIDSNIIQNFDAWWPTYFKKVVISDETSSKNTPRCEKFRFAPSTFKEFRYNADKPGVLEALPFINSLVKHTFRLGKGNLDQLTMNPHEAYPEGRIPINPKKIDDLTKLVKYVADEDAKRFYEDIISQATSVCSSGDD